MEKNDRTEKIVTMLQLAKKSGKLIFGHDAVLKQIKKKKVEMIILALDLSENSRTSIYKNAENCLIDIVAWGTKDLFEKIFGKLVGIIGVTDINFKSGLKEHFSFIKLEV